MGDFADDACHREMDQWLGDIMFEEEDPDWFPVSSCRRRSSKPRGPGKCPLCGSDTIRREGKYGIFYGCSTFPKCKGSRRL